MSSTVINGIKKIYFTRFSKHSKFYRELHPLLGYFPGKPKLYVQAFMHNSLTKKTEELDSKHNNERLEYLGDAVLDLIIAELLFKKFPFQGEGFLTEMRSKSVSRKKLSEIAFNMGLHEHLMFDKSIRKNRTAVQGIAGNALEALVGAIYLDKGYQFSKRFVSKKIVGVHLDFDTLKDKVVNFKSVLNQFAQREKKELEFRVLNDAAEKNIKSYSIGVYLDNLEIAKARAKSKKEAEQLASEKSCEILDILSLQKD
ncbi:MAG TPA: ribonuclease III [Bacteroidetes bacterium]|nr:ribonuclease III [Bacteroidota bacterium]